MNAGIAGRSSTAVEDVRPMPITAQAPYRGYMNTGAGCFENAWNVP